VTLGVFTVVKIQVEVFWVVMLSSVTVGYQHFRGTCCLYLQDEVYGAGKGVIGIGREYKMWVKSGT
jgi:hypothetical protein